ncbi:MAG: hypothetical protein HND58_17475 [Planctomycetota bacterium]|nr:MAG: hypothetical protein HND58_17475 [Planctomycetota bacterium]
MNTLPGSFLILPLVLLSIAAMVFWLWALIDAITNPRLDSSMRLIWVLVIIFLSWLGAILYCAIGRR